MTDGLAQSVQTRLVRLAKAQGVDPNLMLARYAIERFLYRLSRSRHCDRFVLKGALMLLVWLGESIRPTRDADLLGFGDLSSEAIGGIFTEICAVEVEPDGLTFDPSSIRVEAIRPEDAYGGQRVTLIGRLGPARLSVLVDVGIGDAVVPDPEWIEYPTLLDLPRPRLRAYRPETAIAEKVHAMVALGSKNSRMRDFFDIHVLSVREAFDGDTLVRAVRATFERRSTDIPAVLPIALTPVFADGEGKAAQWASFKRKSRLTGTSDDLRVVIAALAAFLQPVLAAAAGGSAFPASWSPGGPWVPSTRPRK